MNKLTRNTNSKRIKVVSVLLVLAVFMVMSCLRGKGSMITIGGPGESGESGEYSNYSSSYPSDVNENPVVKKIKECHNRTPFVAYDWDNGRCYESQNNLVRVGKNCSLDYFRNEWHFSNLDTELSCGNGKTLLSELLECFVSTNDGNNYFPSVIMYCRDNSTSDVSHDSIGFPQ